MSSFTSVILYISGVENETERMEEVNTFKIGNQPIKLIDVNDHTKFPDAFPRFMYVGSFNYFILSDFLTHLQTKVNWEFPEYVQIFVQDELDLTLKVFTNAGKKLALDSIKA